MSETKKSVMIFVDQQNYFHLCRDNGKFMDLLKLRDYLTRESQGRQLLEMVVYYGFPPDIRGPRPASWERRSDALSRQMEKLEYSGILTKEWYGKFVRNERGEITEDYEANIDVLMAVDALEFAVECRPDVVVLVTHDGDFLHLAKKLRRRGIRVEAAGRADMMSGLLKRAVNEVIDLEGFVNALTSMRAGQDVF